MLYLVSFTKVKKGPDPDSGFGPFLLFNLVKK